MIEIVVVLLVLGAATLVFYPVLSGGMTPRRPPAKGRGARAAPPLDAETAEVLAEMVERKNRLLRNLAELEAERAAGRLGEQEFAELQRRDEIAAARAINELELFQAEARSGKKKGHPTGRPAPVPAGKKLGTTIAWVGGTVAFAAILVFTMSKAVTPRSAGGTITGTMPGGGEPEGGGPPPGGSPMMPRANPARLAQLEKTISRDSSNLKALLEAGHLYLAEQKLDQAASVTIRALQQDPETPEGHAHIAVLLFAEAQSQQDPDSAKRAMDGALDAVNHAIQTKPDLAEAWLFKGMIMMAGKRDMKAAAQAWEQYLKIAPPDADTTRIHAIVESAKRGGGR